MIELESERLRERRRGRERSPERARVDRGDRFGREPRRRSLPHERHRLADSSTSVRPTTRSRIASSARRGARGSGARPSYERRGGDEHGGLRQLGRRAERVARARRRASAGTTRRAGRRPPRRSRPARAPCSAPVANAMATAIEDGDQRARARDDAKRRAGAVFAHTRQHERRAATGTARESAPAAIANDDRAIRRRQARRAPTP